MFPCYLRDHGYYCTNNSKEDYNVEKTGKVWDQSNRQAHWKMRSDDQPFFAVFNSTKSHESAIRRFTGVPTHDPAKVRIPDYHPDTPTSRRDWAIYYDSVTRADAEAGQRLKEIEDAGLQDSTIVFYWGDHGSGMPRSKRWPSNSGLHVPLIVYIPEKFSHLRPPEYVPGGESERLVSFVDFAPTMLSLAGIEPPEWMHGHAFLGEYVARSQPYIFGFRGRMDERLDFVRSVTDGRFVYLRNYIPHRSQGQHVNYQFETPTTAEWRSLFDSGKLNEEQSLFWRVPKASEELYDLAEDRDEVHNLAGNEAYAPILQRLRAAQQEKAKAILDLGFVPEGIRFELADGLPFYDWARKDGNYDYELLAAAAESASGAVPLQKSRIVELLRSEHPLVRYWGTMAVLNQGEQVPIDLQDVLAERLKDDTAEVRINAARALSQYARGARRQAAVKQLVADANWKKNDAFSAMLALDALGAYTGDRSTVDSQVKELPSEGDAPHSRYNSYVPRLLQGLSSE